MKPIIPFALLCALATSTAPGAVTDPVGYVTVTLEPGIFNLVGVTLHQPVVASGTLESATASTVVDDTADFTSLTGPLILELNDGSGVIQEVTVQDATTLTTPEDISSFVTAGVSYSVRQADTIDSIFGSDNSKANLVASPDGSDAGVDKVFVQTATGLQQFYYVDAPGTFEGWFDGAGPAGDTVINYADGLYVQTVPTSTATDFQIAGEVKTNPTSSVLQPGFNLVNAVAPAGLTLGNSGLGDFIEASPDGSSATADKVLIPDLNNPGSFTEYFYVNAPGTFVGWFDGAGSADAVELTGPFFLRNVEGSVKPYTISAPEIAD